MWHLNEASRIWWGRSGSEYHHNGRYYYYFQGALYSCPATSDVNNLSDLPVDTRYELPELIRPDSDVIIQGDRQVKVVQGSLLEVLSKSTSSKFVTSDFPWGNIADVLAFLEVTPSGIEPVLVLGKNSGPLFSYGMDGYRLGLPYYGHVGTHRITVLEPSTTEFDSNGITFIADVNDSNTKIETVDFYVDQTCVGQDSNGLDGWQCEWHEPIYGDHYLYARSIGECNDVSYSNAIDFYVMEPTGNNISYPEVSIVEPNHLDQLSTSMPIRISVSVSDLRWKVTSCVFDVYGNGRHFSFEDREPADGWSVQWENPPDGCYLIEAWIRFNQSWRKTEIVEVGVGDGESGDSGPNQGGGGGRG